MPRVESEHHEAPFTVAEYFVEQVVFVVLPLLVEVGLLSLLQAASAAGRTSSVMMRARESRIWGSGSGRLRRMP